MSHTYYTNSYKPPPAPSLIQDELYGPDPYDLNFVYPVHLPSLETDRVKLTPFIPRIYAKRFWSESTKNPDIDLFRYYPIAWSTIDDFLTFLEVNIRRNENNLMFAIIDKTKPDDFPEFPGYGGGSLAGMLALLRSDAPNLMSEIGWVAIFPTFQRTHVATNAVGVLLKHCLDLPTAPTPGLGLRRMEWRAHDQNIPSGRLAERMGFRREGVLRWLWVQAPVRARDGAKPGKGDKWPDRYGRHSQLLSVCWDDWENGVKDIVHKSIDRVS